jgi:5'-methylthioadenosine phosphorylase
MIGMLEPAETAEIGIFAGSGNYDPKLIKEPKEIKVYTPYGQTSDNVIVGYVGEKKVAFLVRHQRGHRIPPHKINFRANVWAMKALGVTRIISPAAVGSLQPERIKPGEFVVCDQIVSFTAAPRMNQTFFDGGVVGHVAFADPFCAELRRVIVDTAAKLGMKIHVKEDSKDHDSFEYVCIEGPRFSTRAESLFYKRQGWDVVGKTENNQDTFSAPQ